MNYIPNIISGLRILLIPLFVYLILNNYYFYSLLLFIAMGSSDAIDGYIARCYNCESTFGAYLDATADKLMIISSLYILCLMNVLPFYILTVVLIRDFIILYGITIKSKVQHDFKLKPIFISKVNTFMQIILVIYCLLCLNNITEYKYVKDMINVVILTTIFIAVEYIYNFKNNNIHKNIRYSSNI